LIRQRLRRSRREREPAELNITAFLALMVILVPFLLIMVAFARMAVLELNLPQAGTANADDELRLEVIVRADALIVGDGRQRIERIPANEQGHDLARLSAVMQAIKSENSDITEISVLLEPDTAYDTLVQVMDTVRMVEVPDPDEPGDTMQAELFPDIALGDAPGGGDT